MAASEQGSEASRMSAPKFAYSSQAWGVCSEASETSVLCHGSTHVYLTGHARCTCGQAANGYPSPAGVAMYPSTVLRMYGAPVNYNPFSPHAPVKPTAPDVPLSRLKAAKDVKAQHLSGDGLRAYRDDRGGIEVAHWNDERRAFDSWWALDGEMPADAVAL